MQFMFYVYFTGDVTSAETEELLSNDYLIKQNYPNPFNPTTTIEYHLPYESQVNISVFNTLGEKVAVLINENRSAGNYSTEWDGTGYSSGIYFYVFRALSSTNNNQIIESRKMILLR